MTATRPSRRRPGRARGAAAVEYIIVIVFILIAGLPWLKSFQRETRCKMTEAPGKNTECDGTANVRLEPQDDGCIGLVCDTNP